MNELSLTPAASAAAASTVFRVEVRNLVVTGPNIPALLSAVQPDMDMVDDMEIDSDDMAKVMIDTLGRLSTARSVVDKDRKEHGQPLLETTRWLNDGYAPALTNIDAKIATGKAKLNVRNRMVAEERRIAEEAENKKRREIAAEAARIEAAAIAAAQASACEAQALAKAGDEEAAQALATQAAIQIDAARQASAQAVQESFTAPMATTLHAPLKGTTGTWNAEVVDKAKLIIHIGQRLAAGDVSLLNLLDVSEKNVRAIAKMQQGGMAIPGLKPLYTESISIRKQAVIS